MTDFGPPAAAVDFNVNVTMHGHDNLNVHGNVNVKP